MDNIYNIGIILPIISLKWNGDNVIQYSKSPKIIKGQCQDNTPDIRHSLSCCMDGEKCEFDYINYYLNNTNNVLNDNNYCTWTSNESIYLGLSIDSFSRVNNSCIWNLKGLIKGEFDDKSSSYVGNNIFSDCIKENELTKYKSFDYLLISESDKGTYKNGWDVTYSITNINNGSICIRYSLINSITLDINYYYTLSATINKLNNRIGQTSLILPSFVQNYLKYTSLIYCSINIFYNTIYQQNIYSNKIINPFIACDRINNLDSYIKNFNFFNNDTLFKDINDIMFFPKVSTENNEYYITLSLSIEQINNLLNQNTKELQKNFLNNLLSNFLRDKEGNQNDPVISISDKIPIIVTGDSSTLFDFENYCFIHIKDSFSSYEIINVTDIKNIPYSSYYYSFDDTSTDKSFYFLLSMPIKLKIEKWSVMLVSYFKSQHPEIVLPDNIINDIQNKIYDKNNMSLTDVQNYCYKEYNFTNGPTNSDIGKYLFTSESGPYCLCYNSHISPQGTQPGNTSAMCFDKNCQNQIGNTNLSILNDFFKISDNTCKTNTICNNINNWRKSGSRNEGEIDTKRYSDFCPNSDTSNTSKNYNLNILIICIFYTILISLFVFLICKNKNYESFTIFLFTFTSFILCLIITYYLSFFLIGEYRCSQKTSKCFSKYNENYNIVIPDEFCDITLKTTCECIFNEDCGSKNCTCAGGTCQPFNGERKFTYKENYNKSYTLIIACSLFSILFPFLFIYASRDYDWHIQKKTSIIIVSIFSIIPIIYAIVISLQKKQIKEYTEKCK